MNSRIPRKLTFTLLIFIMLNLTGCWNSRELDTLSIVHAIAIDRTEDGQVRLTSEILNPDRVKGSSGEIGGGNAVWVTSTTGHTIFEAIRNNALRVDRRLYFAHNKIIIIGEEAAQEGIAPILDLYLRDPELREQVHVLIARGKAEDILRADHPQEKIPAKAIEGLIKATRASSLLPRVTLYDLSKALISKSCDPYIPGIKVEKDTVNKIERFKLDETAVFGKDKLVGWFNHKETRGLLWIRGEVKSGIIVVNSPEAEEQKVALEIIRASSKIKPEIKDDKLVITVEIKELGNLGEQQSFVDLTQSDLVTQLEKQKADIILEESMSAIHKAQNLGVDIFKFGEEVHRKLPKEWPKYEENWKEEFKNVEVIVSVETKISGVGTSTVAIRKD